MATVLTEDNLEFTFGDNWQVVHYDKTTTFTQGIGKLQGVLDSGTDQEHGEGTKAMDFVGLHPDFGLLLMEIKDFRGHRIENKNRVHGEAALEVALKARDTVAGLVGAHRWGKTEGFYGEKLREKFPVKVVLWIESDETIDEKGWSQRLTALGDEMDRKLRWLSVKCHAVGKLLGGGSISDLAVKYLAKKPKS